MHCACDGRCGQHERGKCGVRREGSGKSCKISGCPKDDTCKHSTRATCCQCRNMVSSHTRGTKAKRGRRPTNAISLPGRGSVSPNTLTPSLVAKRRLALLSQNSESKTQENNSNKRQKLSISSGFHDAHQSGSLSDDEVFSQTLVAVLPMTSGTVPVKQEVTAVDELLLAPPTIDFGLSSDIISSFLDETKLEEIAARSLCEYPEWFSRKDSCDLIVIIDGFQFNLHKYPMLMVSRTLNARAHQTMSSGLNPNPTGSPSPIPVVSFPLFPGGVHAFEQLCIYGYTGDICFTSANFVDLYEAMSVLKMDLMIQSKADSYLEQLLLTAPASNLVEMLQSTSRSNRHPHQPRHPLRARLAEALAKLYPFNSEKMQLILQLPLAEFLLVTQLVLLSQGSNPQTLNAIQKRLARLHQDTTISSSIRSEQCIHMLEECVVAGNSSKTAATTDSSDGMLDDGRMWDMIFQMAQENSGENNSNSTSEKENRSANTDLPPSSCLSSKNHNAQMCQQAFVV